jgi:hypothetical protein
MSSSSELKVPFLSRVAVEVDGTVVGRTVITRSGEETSDESLDNDNPEPSTPGRTIKTMGRETTDEE